MSVVYFAYGSNIAHEILVNRRGISIVNKKRADLLGYEFVFSCPGVNKYEPCFANIRVRKAASVYGMAYEISVADFDKLLKSEAGLYDVLDVTIIDEQQNEIQAKTLVATSPIQPDKPSLRYHKILVQGAIEANLPVAHLELLERVGYSQPPPFYGFISYLINLYLKIKNKLA